MKVRIIIKVALLILEVLARQSETRLDDVAVEKIKDLLDNKEKKTETTTQ